jgi:outer membrane protein assembly factor BamB
VIRLRPGRGWRLNPALLTELRAQGRSGHAAPEIRDVLSLEIDGVDLLAGLSEDSLLEVIAELARSVAKVMAGRRCSRVSCSGGGVELLLERRGSQLLLSLVRLQRPARVTVSDLEIELSALAQAVLDGGRLLLRDLRTLHPAIVETPPARQLSRALKALAEQKLLAPESVLRRRGARQPLVYAQSGVQRPAVRLELEDPDSRLEAGAVGTELHSLLVRGRLVLRLPGGASDIAFAGHPFLLLRDLTAAGLDMVRGLEAGDSEHLLPLTDGVGLSFDLRHGLAAARATFVRQTTRGAQVGRAGSFHCPALPTLTALFEAATAFTAAAMSRSPLQRQNRYLVELSRSAEEGLSRCAELRMDSQPRRALSLRAAAPEPAAVPPRPPAAPGRLRRLAYETLWKSTKVRGVTRLFLSGRHLIAIGERGAWGFDVQDGTLSFSLLGEGVLVASCGGGLIAAQGRSLRRFDRKGQVRWSSARFGLTGPASSLAVCGSARPGRPLAAVASANELVCFSTAGGNPLWRFTPPGCSGLSVSTVAGLILLATSDGRLYGISTSGKIAWRARCGAGLSARPLSAEDELFVAVRRPEAPRLLRLGLRDGQERPMENPVLSRLSGLASLPTLPVLAAGTSGGEGAVTAYGPEGRIAWRFEHREMVGAGTPLVTPVLDSKCGLLVRGGRALTFLEADGKVRWSHPLSEELHGGIAPIVERGVAFAAGDLGLFAFDLETGVPLGGALASSLYPVGLAVDPDLTLYLAEEEGPLAALRLQSYLAVV